MAQREISNLDLKVKLTKEYLDNGGYEKIDFIELLEGLKNVRRDAYGKVIPDTVSTSVNAFMMLILASQLKPPIFSPDCISEYESTLQKSNCFDQENIDTEEQFDRIYEEYKNKTDYLFRGQREAKWRLYSTLQRHWILGKLSTKVESYQNLLEIIITDGREGFRDKIFEMLGEQHDDADNDIAILGFLQHHGCPTPLLDWTYKFHNALYFAIDGLDRKGRKREIDDYFSVYFIQEKNFENGGMRNIIYESINRMQEPLLMAEIAKIAEDDVQRAEMENHFRGRKIIDIKRVKGSGLIAHMTKVQHVINFPATYFGDNEVEDDIVFSIRNSKNIQNQAGVFTWNANPCKPFEIVVSEQNKEANNSNEEDEYILCECFNINKKLEEHVRNRLKEDGITKEKIYPTPELNTWSIFEKAVSKF